MWAGEEEGGMEGWEEYMRDVREAAILGNVADRCSVNVGEHVQRPGGMAAQVTRSFNVTRCGDTWALEYGTDHENYPFSLAGFLYPMVTA